MDPRHIVRSHLRLLREAWTPATSEAHGLVYRGAADFVLQHGRWWRPSHRPPGVTAGPLGKCYGNSITVAVLYGLRYVEGWCLPHEGALAVPHAWVADKTGRAIDVTWGPGLAAAYLGVEFSVERADDATWNGDACVLDDWHRKWPLFRERWTGEGDPDPAWAPSPMLLAARARVAGDMAECRRQLDLGDEEVGRPVVRWDSWLDRIAP